MGKNFNYQNDNYILSQPSRTNVLGTSLVFLSIGHNGRWLLATADLRLQNIYHDNFLSGTNGTPTRNGATILTGLLTDLEQHMDIDTDKSNWTCHNSTIIQAPQHTGTRDCGVFYVRLQRT